MGNAGKDVIVVGSDSDSDSEDEGDTAAETDIPATDADAGEAMDIDGKAPKPEKLVTRVTYEELSKRIEEVSYTWAKQSFPSKPVVETPDTNAAGSSGNAVAGPSVRPVADSELEAEWEEFQKGKDMI